MERLKTAVWAGPNEPTPQGFKPPFPLGEREPAFFKPHGGMWTSPYEGEYGSAWCQWCLSEEFRIDREKPDFHLWLLEPDPEKRVYLIDSYEDLEALIDLYPSGPAFQGLSREWPNWKGVSEDFDAIHLTEKGQWATRLTTPYSLYGWDCESTLWFRWGFESVEDLGIVRVKARDAWWEDDE